MGEITLKHLLTIEELTLQQVMGLIMRAEQFKRGAEWHPEKHLYAANLFFEDSTRTHRSFEMAERKLNIDVIQFEASTSSLNKGESLYDTVLTMAAIGVDIVVIRHPQEEYYKQLVDSSSIRASIINGGDGKGQHPTQCLLDLMTIYEEFGHFDGLKIAIVGDISNSRVARSNAGILQRLGAEVYFSGPAEWYNSEFDRFGQQKPIDELVPTVDVMMMLRVQHERHDGKSTFSREDYHTAYGLTLKRAANMRKEAIIMHPAPVNRDVELADELVEAKNSRIVTQMTNGVYIRMAVLEAIVGGREKR